MTQEPLFSLPGTPPLRRPESPITGTGKMKWTPYNAVQARKCDDCLQVGLECWRDGKPFPLARQARHKLTQDKKAVAFVCSEHKLLRSG